MELIRDSSWREILAGEFAAAYFASLGSFVDEEYSRGEVYPPRERIFAAFEMTPFDAVKVVILGQDPYHEPGQAQGLAFYVPPDVKAPPSLRNIAAELAQESSAPGAAPLSPTTIPDLADWARQGVLLLNATLTVGAHRPLSHQKKGWETFTDAAVRSLAERRESLVFMLWGAHAQKKGEFIDRSRHLVLAAAHPSPLSARRGFFGCNHFRLANDYLAERGKSPIAWL